MRPRIAVLLALAAAAGCRPATETERYVRATFVAGPWDEPVGPARDPVISAKWAEGVVVEVDEVGHKFRARITKGEAQAGERMEVYFPPDADMNKRFIPGGMRGMHVLSARIIRKEGDLYLAEVMEKTRRAAVHPGDRVIVRVP